MGRLRTLLSERPQESLLRNIETNLNSEEMEITPQSSEQVNKSQNDSQESTKSQASTALSQSIFLSEAYEDNVEQLENTAMDIEETSSTIPQPQIAKSFNVVHPEALVEAWIVHSKATKAENREAIEDARDLIALPSFVYERKLKFKKFRKESLIPLPSIQKPLTLKHKP
ncbi:hypothetical protein TorRG33x02_059650, partial [Trema orientale]